MMTEPTPAPVVTTTTTVTPAPAPSELTMTIGAKEIYDGLLRVEAKVDAIPTTDHETRIRMLERWRYATGGALGIAVSALVQGLRVKHGG